MCNNLQNTYRNITAKYYLLLAAPSASWLDHDLTSPRAVQSTTWTVCELTSLVSWQSVSWRIHELSSYHISLYGNWTTRGYANSQTVLRTGSIALCTSGGYSLLYIKRSSLFLKQFAGVQATTYTDSWFQLKQVCQFVGACVQNNLWTGNVNCADHQTVD